MRISVWQQFSSNHSAMYTVVGLFDSDVAARIAGEKIRQSVVEIAAWYEQNKEQSRMLGGNTSPLEEQLAREYHFDWKEPVDWLYRFPRYFLAPFQREPDEHVIISDRLVIVDAPGASSTWQTGHQFANLIGAMGGKPYSTVYMGNPPDILDQYVFENILFNLQATAPSIELAAEIHHELTVQLENIESPSKPIPWITYHPRYAHLMGNVSKEEFAKLERVWIEQHKVWSEFRESRTMSVEEVREQSRSFLTQDELLSRIIYYLRTETWLGKADCNLRENKIELNALESERIDALPAIIAWMQDKGCKVNYQFHQEEQS